MVTGGLPATMAAAERRAPARRRECRGEGGRGGCPGGRRPHHEHEEIDGAAWGGRGRPKSVPAGGGRGRLGEDGGDGSGLPRVDCLLGEEDGDEAKLLEASACPGEAYSDGGRDDGVRRPVLRT